MVQFMMLYVAFFHMMIGMVAARYLHGRVAQVEELSNIDSIILNDPNLSTLAEAFEASGLVGVLCNNCNYTTFAPNNDAFAAVDQDLLTTLLTPSWILHLQNLLAFHATVPTGDGERFLSTDYVDGLVFEMLNAEFVTVSTVEGGITLTSPLTNGSMIVSADALASNGVVQTVDAVLIPNFLAVNVFALGDIAEDFTILQELLELAAFTGTSGEFTLLAPTNDAFLALGEDALNALKNDTTTLTQILSNHAIDVVYPSVGLQDGQVLQSLGGLEITVGVSESPNGTAATVTVNDVTVVVADILARNGIAHALSAVLLPPTGSPSPVSAPTVVSETKEPTAMKEKKTKAPGGMGKDKGGLKMGKKGEKGDKVKGGKEKGDKVKGGKDKGDKVKGGKDKGDKEKGGKGKDVKVKDGKEKGSKGKGKEVTESDDDA
jgi:transforming growth factor-beta-induced protein